MARTRRKGHAPLAAIAANALRRQQKLQQLAQQQLEPKADSSGNCSTFNTPFSSQSSSPSATLSSQDARGNSPTCYTVPRTRSMSASSALLYRQSLQSRRQSADSLDSALGSLSSLSENSERPSRRTSRKSRKASRAAPRRSADDPSDMGCRIALQWCCTGSDWAVEMRVTEWPQSPRAVFPLAIYT